MNNLKSVLILIVLVVIFRIIAFFAGSETAYLSLSKIKMRQLLHDGKKNANTAAKLKENIDELLTLILIGTNLMNTLASALATSLAVQLTGSSGVGIATGLITFFSTIFGQIVPKTAASVRVEKTVLKSAVSLTVLEKVFFPVVWIFSLISKSIANLAGKIWKFDNTLVTEEELVTLFDVGTKEGTLDSGESQMLSKIFKFNDLNVHDLMKHRSFVQSVSLEATKKEVVKKFNETGLKVIAVYKDTTENIVGVIHYKSVLLNENADENVNAADNKTENKTDNRRENAETNDFSDDKLSAASNDFSDDKGKQDDFTESKNPEIASPLSGKNYALSIMNGAMFVPETMSALELLSEFKKQRTEFAVALNEQGSLSGVVTMDDILRVVFGRITDEKNKVSPESRIKLVNAGEFLVPGELELDDVNEFFKLGLESEEFSTLGGWLLEEFGYLPQVGEKIVWKNAAFTVEEQFKRRIVSVRIKLGVRK